MSSKTTFDIIFWLIGVGIFTLIWRLTGVDKSNSESLFSFFSFSVGYWITTLIINSLTK